MALFGKLPGERPSVPVSAGTAKEASVVSSCSACVFNLQRCFPQTDLINGHVTGWCHLANGFGKVQSVTFIQIVPFSAPFTPCQWAPKIHYAQDGTVPAADFGSLLVPIAAKILPS